MQLTPIKLLTDAQMAEFENECFRSWLNQIDARIEYDNRRALGSVGKWRTCFDFGMAPKEAIEDLQYARDNSAYCGE